jgi:peptidoglycan/LPS O-acetylase OafA/YrhL
MRNTDKLTTTESLALDVIRVGAAIVVVIGHLTQSMFSFGIPNLVLIGRGAVAIFFILSGFVIRHVTVSRPGTMGKFFKDRASRVYSVALPAMLVTIVADTISHRVNPAFYSTWNMTEPQKIYGIVANLLWTAQLWTRFDNPLSNLPFWSLNYEVIYYVTYGCAFYLSGAKRWLCIAFVSIIAGPKIMFFFPIWLIGCYAHDLYQKWQGARKAGLYLNFACSAIALVILVLGINHKLARDAMDFYMILYKEGKHFKLGRTSGVIDFYAISVAGSILLVRLLTAIRSVRIRADGVCARCVRYLAEGTFAIYLTHFPLLILVASCIPYNHASLWQKAVILIAVITFGVLVGQICRNFKTTLRATELRSLKRTYEPVS